MNNFDIVTETEEEYLSLFTQAPPLPPAQFLEQNHNRFYFKSFHTPWLATCFSPPPHALVAVSETIFDPILPPAVHLNHFCLYSEIYATVQRALPIFWLPFSM